MGPGDRLYYSGKHHRHGVPLEQLRPEHRAVRAHGQGPEVRISRTLTRTGRRAELKPDDSFRVL
ncbi:hypothetical protein [Actinomadura sp. SCN-SB]|uniref:hypothetical protein n=1 Tax=Actinomadura sp. SCN-SB TaxID=3373092 RepID=UPI003753A997